MSSTPALSSLWMSPAWVWSLFLILLALTLLASLRFDWLKVWWQDQLRRASHADEGEQSLADDVALPDARPRRRHEAPPAPVSRGIQASRAPTHRATVGWTHTATPHAGVQRTLFHRSGRRH